MCGYLRWLFVPFILLLNVCGVAQEAVPSAISQTCAYQSQRSALLFAPVLVDGDEVAALVDTGSEISVLDSSYLDSLLPRSRPKIREGSFLVPDGVRSKMRLCTMTVSLWTDEKQSLKQAC